MPMLSWDPNFLSSMNILTTGDGDDDVKILSPHATTGLSGIFMHNVG